MSLSYISESCYLHAISTDLTGAAYTGQATTFAQV